MSTGEQTPAGGNEGSVLPTESSTSSQTGVTATPAKGIDLPPLPSPALLPPSDPSRGRSLDGILCLLLLVFAFLTASFKAYNSDLFMHLATGRLIAEGKYAFGTDPFSFASQGIWVNHSWLFDWLIYGLYAIGTDGIVLDVAKALLVVAIAWVMLRAVRDPGQNLWLPICCTTLGVLTLSPRVWLQPTIVSMFLLAVFFLILSRSALRPRRLWLLPLLCILWANLDAWFFLGPLTVLAYWLGQFIGSFRRESATRRRGEFAAQSPGDGANARPGLRGLPGRVFVQSASRRGLHALAHGAGQSGGCSGVRDGGQFPDLFHVAVSRLPSVLLQHHRA